MYEQLFSDFTHTPQILKISPIPQWQIKPNHLKEGKTFKVKQKLGRLAEELFAQCIDQDPELKVVLKNYQVVENKRTLGEIDFILKDTSKSTHTHIELAYKVYLADLNNYQLDTWVGPNRRDKLADKLKHLVRNQIPLTQNPACQKLLMANKIDQLTSYLCLIGQLYTPMDANQDHYLEINKEAIAGHWLFWENIDTLKECKFYLLEKWEWMLRPHINVNWQSYHVAKAFIEQLVEKKIAPMVWIKHPNGNIKKVFVVWWKNEVHI